MSNTDFIYPERNAPTPPSVVMTPPPPEYPTEVDTALNDPASPTVPPAPTPRVEQSSIDAYTPEEMAQQPSVFDAPASVNSRTYNPISDSWKAVAAASYGILAGLRNTGAYFATTKENHDAFVAGAQNASEWSRYYADSSSPESKAALEYSRQHPFSLQTLWNLPLYVSGMAPEAVMAFAPGGAIGGAVGLAVTGGIAGVLGFGDSITRMRDTLDQIPDDQYLTNSPGARKLVEQGMSPHDAVEKSKEISIGYLPWYNAIFNALSFVAAGGPAARMVPGFLDKGLLTRIAINSGFDATIFAATGATSAATYNAALEQSGQPFDPANVGAEALSAAEMGAVLSVPFVGKGRAKVEPVNEVGVGSAEDAALKAAKPAAPGAGAGPPVTSAGADAPVPAGVMDAGTAGPRTREEITNAISVAEATGADTTALKAKLAALPPDIPQAPPAAGGPPAAPPAGPPAPPAVGGPPVPPAARGPAPGFPRAEVGPTPPYKAPKTIDEIVYGGGDTPAQGPPQPPSTVVPDEAFGTRGAPGAPAAVVAPATPYKAPQSIDQMVYGERGPGPLVTPEGSTPAEEDLYNRAVGIVRTGGKASTTLIQRRLGIGYARAADIVGRMEREGVVTPADASGRRTVVAEVGAPPVTPESNVKPGARAKETGRRRTAKKATPAEPPVPTVGAVPPSTMVAREAGQLGENIETSQLGENIHHVADTARAGATANMNEQPGGGDQGPSRGGPRAAGEPRAAALSGARKAAGAAPGKPAAGEPGAAGAAVKGTAKRREKAPAESAAKTPAKAAIKEAAPPGEAPAARPATKRAVGPKGEEALAVTPSKGRILEDRKTKPVDQNAVITRHAAAAVAKEERAKFEAGQIADKEAGVARDTKQSNAKKAAASARVTALSKLFTDNGPRAKDGTPNWTVPNAKTSTSPEAFVADWHKFLDKVIGLAKTADDLKPLRAIHKGSSDGDLFGREIVSAGRAAERLRSTKKLVGNQKARAEAHLHTFLGRINSVKVNADGTFDTSAWREDRRTEGYINRKGGTATAEATGDVTEAFAEAPSRSTGARVHEKAPAGKTTIIDPKSARGMELAAAAEAKLGPTKLGKPPGKTQGTTHPVTSGSNKKVGPRTVEVLEKVKAKAPVAQSTAGLDRKITKAATVVEDLRAQLADTTRGTEKHRQIAAQLEGALRDEEAATVQGRRRLLTHEHGIPSEEEIQTAESQIPDLEARIAREVAANRDTPSNDNLRRWRQQLAQHEGVLLRAEPDEPPGSATPRDYIPNEIWSDKQTPHAVRMIARRIQYSGKEDFTPVAPIRNTIPKWKGGGTESFNSIYNSTVGALAKDINIEDFATRLFGFNSLASDGVIRRIFDVTKNVPVYFANQERDLALLNESEFYGLHKVRGDGKSMLFFNVGPMAKSTEEYFRQSLLHEALHAFTVAHLRLDMQFTMLVDDLRVHMESQPELFKGWTSRDLYGLTNAREFISEAFSYPKFNELLRYTPAPPRFIKLLGLDKLRNIAPTMFDALIASIGRLFPGRQTSVFDALLRIVGDQTRKDIEPPLYPRGTQVISFPPPSALPAKFGNHMRSARDWTARAVDHAINSDAPDNRLGKMRVIRLASGDYIARMSDKYFGEGDKNPVRRLVEGFERTRVDSANELKAALPLVKRMFDAEAKHGPEQWSKFVDVAHDSTNAGIYPDRAFDKQGFTKDGLGDVQAKARHADLAARYAALPDDLKTLYQDAYRFYSAQQNKLNLATIRNRLLKIAEIPLDADGEALANRIFLNKMTEADMGRLGDLAAPLANTNILGKVKGAYFPLMRRGDHVIVGRYKIAAPLAATNATKVANPEKNLIYEFGAGNVNKAKARRDAMAYAAGLPQDAKIESVWVDRKTGELYSESDQGPVKVMMNDVHADHRWRVNVQDRHVEFAHGLRNADRRAAELQASSAMESVDPVQEVANQNFPGGGYLASQLRTLQTSMEKRPGYSGLPDAVRSQMAQVMREASTRLLASTRIETRSLPRRHVAGAGREVVKDMLDYARASGGRLAQLRHAPEVDAALTDLNRLKGDDNTGALGRSQIANEMNRRAIANNGYNEGNKLTQGLQRFMGLTFTTDLASPSTSLLNLTQVGVLAYPALAGRYGPIKAFTAIRRAYRDVGVLRQLKKGLADTGRAVAAKDINYDYLTELRASLPETERAVIDRAIAVGTLDPEVGLEVAGPVDRYHAITPAGELANKAGAAIDWAQTVFRQVPRSIEVINRSTVLLAAYRLERGHGAAHAEAMQKAIDTVNQTQFHYAASNRAPVFNNKWARLLLQFKQYPMGVMQMIGENLSKAYYNLHPGDRAEAVKTLAYMASTQVAMAGVLGLPTEPIKLLFITLGAAGVPVPSWSEVEGGERRLAAGLFGEFGGRLLSKGAPAAFLNTDVSGRAGMNNWFTFGEPDSHDMKDTFLWTAEQFFGAPGSLVANQFRGLQQLAAGDYEHAAENLVPIKGVSSIIRAHEGSQGKQNVHGRQTLEPYSATEDFIRGLGFTPTREAEAGTRRSVFHQQQTQYHGERQKILDAWANAPPSERGRMWGDVERYNRQQAPEDRIKRSALDEYVRQRGHETTMGGEVMRGPGDVGRMTPLLQTFGE